jgi:TrmH family RNA methyltransferase
MNLLKRIRVVLVEPSHPGNIGAAARAMKTMGLEDLLLVRPKAFPHAEASARAAGADDVLARARVENSLAVALGDCTYVLGASARPRSLAWPALDARSGAQWVTQMQPTDRAALVFGRERSGLTNDELDLCQRLVQIPVNPDYPSLNLAAAVQVLCYECRIAAGGRALPRQSQSAAAPVEDVELFYEHLQRVLVRTGFLDLHAPRHLMRRMRRLYGRAHLDVNEVNILRGILTSVENALSRVRRV